MNQALKFLVKPVRFLDLPLWYIICMIATCWAFVVSQSPLAFGPLLALGFGQFLAHDVKRIYLLLFLFIPLSTEVYLPMGLGTDVPTEQFMWMLTGLGVVLFLYSWSKIPSTYVYHPLTLLLIGILGWILVTTITSQNILQSFKYFLARSWYIISMFFMTLYFIKSKEDLAQVFSYFFFGLVGSVVVIMFRHGLVGFSYEEINFVLFPFYRNHVNYACLLAISLPYFFWYATTRSKSSQKRLLLALFGLMLIALYFTYTRAAILAAMFCPIFYFLVKKRFVIYASLMALVVAIGISYSVVQKYNYLAYAPNYESTIQHQSFDDVLSATYQLEDLSTMERVYRWVAGYHMIKARPFLGFGPSNFYSFYRPFTVESFTTYVSDNEDQSGIHNYYLMLLVEQGFPGLLLFIALVLLAFYKGQQLYHSLYDIGEKRLILAALGSLCITLIISLMNDMLETDKVGTLFLFSLALIVRGEVIRRSQN